MNEESGIYEISETESLLLSEGESSSIPSEIIPFLNSFVIIFVTYLVFHIVHNVVGRMSQIGG